MDARLAFVGPLGRGEGAKDQAPPGGMGTDVHAFSSGQDALSKSPFDPSRTCRAWMPGERALGVPFSLVGGL
ncbi:hypothetical protein GCM10007863_36600 [Dyella mobilis]|nr:hypothetical protein GCM10007863_36600 [Dyella mobilis]